MRKFDHNVKARLAWCMHGPKINACMCFKISNEIDLNRFVFLVLLINDAESHRTWARDQISLTQLEMCHELEALIVLEAEVEVPVKREKILSRIASRTVPVPRKQVLVRTTYENT